jgi:hypothetical protein
MTTTSATKPTRWTTLRTAQLLALVGGVLLIVDTVTIAIINGGFDPIDSVLFLAGLTCMLGTAVALAVLFSATRRGLTRVLLGVGVFMVFALVLGAIASAFDTFGRHLFSASNKGLHGEWSFFSIGVCLTLLAWQLPIARRHFAGIS